VPRVDGVAAAAALQRAVEDGLRGDDGPRGGLSCDAHAIGEGLHAAEVPAGAALLLVEDEVRAPWPLLAGVEGGRELGECHRHHEGEDTHTSKHFSLSFLSLSNCFSFLLAKFRHSFSDASRNMKILHRFLGDRCDTAVIILARKLKESDFM
jgi:hypothetical protein